MTGPVMRPWSRDPCTSDTPPSGHRNTVVLTVAAGVGCGWRREIASSQSSSSSRRGALLGVRRLPVPARNHLLPVRWYLHFGRSYRAVDELLAERCVEVDHVTIFRWVQRLTLELIDAARPCRHAVDGRRFVDGPTSVSPACGGSCAGRLTSAAK